MPYRASSAFFSSHMTSPFKERSSVSDASTRAAWTSSGMRIVNLTMAAWCHVPLL